MSCRSVRLALLSLVVAANACSPTPAQPETALPPRDSTRALTPPMGWNSWNAFVCNYDEQTIRGVADAMVTSGMRDAGYEYVNIDDCWMAPRRDPWRRLQADPVRFPSGIKALADYVHARGLKFGIYSSAGFHTCWPTRLPGSLGYEDIDAATFAEWGVDYLKYDNCGNRGMPAEERYAAMGWALHRTGRKIVYSVCEWGANQPWHWGSRVGGHLWRTTPDIIDTWASIMNILDRQVPIAGHARPGAWNDMDMLYVGHALSASEYRSHFSLWALLNSPLLAGNDPRYMSEEVRLILTNREVIAVNQDWGGRQGNRVSTDGIREVWAKPMSDGSVAIVLLNRGDADASVSSRLADLGLTGATEYVARDLWARTERVVSGSITAQLSPHESAMFVIRAR